VDDQVRAAGPPYDVMSEELEVLLLVAQRLTAANIPYMVTGSMAANYYTVPRMTRDIDLVAELSESDVDRIVELFDADFYIDREAAQQAVRDKGIFNIIHSAYVIKVDLIVRQDQAYRREEFSRRREVTVEGQRLSIVAPEDLILSKLDWAKDTRSEVQLADVRKMLRSVEGLDRQYLAHWSQALGIESLYREVSQ
jgi:hypothetical protein